MIEMVSTRKVSAVTEELCGSSMSKSTVSRLCGSLDQSVEVFKNRPLESSYPFVQCDAIYLKVREDGKVRSKGLHIAVEINQDGVREVLGFSLSDKESETSCEVFFRSLKERGLKNVDVLTSDAHLGLTKAISKCFPGCSWQRCQTHFSRNVLDSTPSKHKTEIHLSLQQMYQADNIEIARRIRDEIMECYAKSAPKAIDILEKRFDEVLTVLSLSRA